MATLTRGQMVTAARERGFEASDRDVQRAIVEGRLEPAPEKIADRYAYTAAHLEQFVTFLGTIRRRVPAPARSAS